MPSAPPGRGDAEKMGLLLLGVLPSPRVDGRVLFGI